MFEFYILHFVGNLIFIIFALYITFCMQSNLNVVEYFYNYDSHHKVSWHKKILTKSSNIPVFASSTLSLSSTSLS